MGLLMASPQEGAEAGAVSHTPPPPTQEELLLAHDVRESTAYGRGKVLQPSHKTAVIEALPVKEEVQILWVSPYLSCHLCVP